MTYWKRFHEEQARGTDDPKGQVGKVVNRVPVSDEQFELIIDDICSGLQLSGTETVLDLGCGNGLVTHRIVARSGRVMGVDFVEDLIAMARQNFAGPTIEYQVGNILTVDLGERTFDAIYSYEVVQLLDLEQAIALVRRLRDWLNPGGRVLLCGIPDLARRWDYYDTPEKRAYSEAMDEAGTPHLGTWFDRTELTERVEAEGFRVTCIAQNPELYTAYYRYNLRLDKA